MSGAVRYVTLGECHTCALPEKRLYHPGGESLNLLCAKCLKKLYDADVPAPKMQADVSEADATFKRRKGDK